LIEIDSSTGFDICDFGSDYIVGLARVASLSTAGSISWTFNRFDLFECLIHERSAYLSQKRRRSANDMYAVEYHDKMPVLEDNQMWIETNGEIMHPGGVAVVILAILTSIIALLPYAVIQAAALHRKSPDCDFRRYIRFCYFTGMAIVAVWPSSLVLGDKFGFLGSIVAWWSCTLFWLYSLYAFSLAPIRYTWLPLFFAIGIYWSPFLGAWLFQYDDTFRGVVGVASLFLFGCIFLAGTYLTDKTIPQPDPELLGCGKPEHS
jgi:hypothetical protein